MLRLVVAAMHCVDMEEGVLKAGTGLAIVKMVQDNLLEDSGCWWDWCIGGKVVTVVGMQGMVEVAGQLQDTTVAAAHDWSLNWSVLVAGAAEKLVADGSQTDLTAEVAVVAHVEGGCNMVLSVGSYGRAVVAVVTQCVADTDFHDQAQGGCCRCLNGTLGGMGGYCTG